MRDAKGNLYELGSVSTDVPRGTLVPRMELRTTLQVGDQARLLVHVNGADYIQPWVTVVEATPSGYVGLVAGVSEWLPRGTRFAFTADNVTWTRDA